MNKSLWTDTVILPKFNTFKGDKKTDVLIIGGGLAGLLCAYKLKNLNVDYILVDADSIGMGTTHNTTGKITSLHGLIYSDMAFSYGKEKAQMYLSANEKAINEYKELSKIIPCDFEIRDSYTYTLTNRRKIEDEVRVVTELGKDCVFCEKTELPFKIKGAVKFKNQARFNPLKFIGGICKDLNIYEETFVRYIDKNRAVTDNGTITAEKIIVATHFPFINTHGSYFIKLYQHRSYVSVFKNTPSFSGMYVSDEKDGMSFLGCDDMLLVGGGGHRTGKQGGAWKDGEKFVKKYYSNGEMVYKWATQDTISLDKIPYIGHYSKRCKDLYVATGFNKWGMSSSMVAADILSDMVMGRINEYKEVFSPHRSIIKPQLLVNGFESAMNLLTPTLRRCPHLGCALKWNKYEHTWDCPCHGSRFTSKGEVINNPAMKELNI